MCQHLNEADSTTMFLQQVVEMKDHRIEELENLVDDLKSEIKRLKEYEWMYKDLCE
jgi:hypothetical protein